jgi:hypothetical protein
VPELEGIRLAIMPRPRGDEWLAEEVRGWSRLGLNHVISLLEPHEVRELGLARGGCALRCTRPHVHIIPGSRSGRTRLFAQSLGAYC